VHRTLVLNVVGLTQELLGTSTPNLSALVARGGCRPVQSMLPAVTCPVQATYLSGEMPRTHGIVANGWYDRELAEVMFWKQSHHLVGGEKVWEAARRIDPSFTCAQLFWWFNMYAPVDWSATPRPIYCADGRKLPDLYTEPPVLGDELRSALGPFPLFDFWGPRAGIRSSRWIADAARHVLDSRKPTLTFVYLPHLDYDLQRFGPNDARLEGSLRAIDEVCGELIAHAEKSGIRLLVLSEYGIEAVDRPVHLNRALRSAGLLRVRDELGQEKLDPGASEAFAVADHQVAHVYVKRRVNEVAALLRALPGVEVVLDEEGKRAFGLDHPRSGDLVAIAAPRAWFTYYYWLDDARAPDFARTVDIHRKPGYDPAELFLDRALRIPEARVAFRLAQKKLGMRALLDLIGLDASDVRGSHGRLPERPSAGPMIASSHPDALGTAPVRATDVKSLVLRHVFGAPLLESGTESRAAHPALET
jgi:predicted AlkP superfamily pyrophosphatase or phosphodiesterase